MYKKILFLMFVLPLILISTVNAKNITWVAQDWDANGDGVNDSNEWVVKLRAEGYTVDFKTDGYWNALTQAKVDELNTADLVIVSGTIQSGTFATDDAEVTLWNSVTAPMLNCNPYLLRSTRWKWVNNGDSELPNNNGDQGSPDMVAVMPSHPIFYGVALEGGKVKVVDPTLGTGQASFIATANVGNGTLIAKPEGNDWIWVAEWQKGVEFYTGAGAYATNHRMYISIGYHETSDGTTIARGYNLTDDGWEIYLNTIRYMLGESINPGLARSPNPSNGETDVIKSTSLSWKPGVFADKHNVYFGTDFNDVNDATIDDQLSANAELDLPSDVNSINPGSLTLGTTYYWRVDEVNAPENPGTVKGTVWSFTVEPVALKMASENITATASSGDPNKTIDGSGFDDPNFPDQHSIDTPDMWLGTGIDANGTWIRYDFDKLYKLNEMHVWNYNATLYNKRYGIKDVLIEYSEDGDTWTEVTSVTELPYAPAKSYYTYFPVPLGGVIAKSVRITEMSTWNNGGPGSKAGLSEVQFFYIPVRARRPSPQTGSTDISATDTTLSWRAGRDGVTHKLYIDTDEAAVTNGTSTAHTVSESSYVPTLNLGRTYYWCVTETNTSETPSVWQSDIWDFTTTEYISIDDFEDYNDNQDQGYAIFETWDDGYYTSSINGGLIGNQTTLPFAEKTIVQHGNQSAPVFYDNATGTAVNSEVSRSYIAAQNWTSHGADTLRLYYRGSAVTFQETSDGSVAMSGAGADIWNNSDQFRFAYKALNGNGSITARVDSIENTNVWAKAGVMIRNSLDPNAAHAMSIMAASGTGSFQRRVAKDGTSTGTDVTGLGHPYWVKISRSGTTLTAQRSADGVNWYSFETDPNTASTETISMGTNVYIGLVVTSHTNDVLAAATFSNISTTGNVTGAWTVANIGVDQADGGNTLDSLYVSLTDSASHSKKIFAPSTALGTGVWVEWEIPLSDFTGVTASQITKIAVGAGDPSSPLRGQGEFYMDNISFGHPISQ